MDGSDGEDHFRQYVVFIEGGDPGGVMYPSPSHRIKIEPSPGLRPVIQINGIEVVVDAVEREPDGATSGALRGHLARPV
jgi:hypothetical protein